MAQNLFEKYGVKEVADVTLFRIERKDKTLESQRKIPISSILKGALTVDTVYPLDEDGKGAEEGFEAYVFKKADILNHYNYDCDDEATITGKGRVIDLISEAEIYSAVDPENSTLYTDIPEDGEKFEEAAASYYTQNADSKRWNVITTALNAGAMSLDSAFDAKSYRNVKSKLANWISDSKNFKVSSFVISNLVDTKKTVVGSELESAQVYEDLNKTYTYTLSIDPAKKAVYTDDELEALADGIQIELTDAQWKNEPVRYWTIKQAFAAKGIDIVARDLIGYYLVQREDGAPVTGTLYLDPRVDQTITINGRWNYEKSADTLDEDATDVIENGGFTTVYTIKGNPSTSLTVDNLIKIDGVPKTVISKLEDGTATLDFVDGDVKAFIKKFAGVTGVSVETTIDGDIDVDEDDTIEAIETYISKGTETEFYTINVTSIIANVTLVSQKIYSFDYTMIVSASGDADFGIYEIEDAENGANDAPSHYVMDPDYSVAGTHEFTYPEQICMLFAKNQNLITKRGARYQFTNANSLFGDFEFSDDFASAPNGRDRVVICGLVGKLSENLYDLNEVNDAIKAMTDKIEAKSYDIVYTDYAELVVEDEMGFYIPDQLGHYDRASKTMGYFANGLTYTQYAEAGKGVDLGLAAAVNTWGDDTHYSINDAIDALKQEVQMIDGELDVTAGGFERIFGGYLVKGKNSYKYHGNARPTDDRGAFYQYRASNGLPVKRVDSEEAAHSGYSLEEVLTELARMEAQVEGTSLRVESENFHQSNRAIYVDPNMSATSARANIYLLRNIQAKNLASDTNGIFEFYDKKGNKVHYQDLVFTGTEYLALVTIGAFGLIFVVERHGNKNIEKTAWMINENGYLTDKQAERIVKNGLIHTVNVTVCDESFDATCTVGSIKVRKTKKSVLHYVPVLFLDTLKVSTIEQAAESTDATGGRGNAKLITWDYGKEITLSIEDALYTPASMAAIWGGQHGDLKNGVKDTHVIDRMEQIQAKRSFIVPAGNSEGTPTEGEMTAQAVYFDPKTMEPFQDGTPIAEGEVIYKFTRSIAYDNNSIGNTIEISADGFPGTYKVVGETLVRDKATGEDQRFQFIIPEAKMSASNTSITLESEGDPAVFSFTMDVLRPADGVMMKFVQFDVVENEEENDGSTMVKNTENLNLLDDAEMYKVSGGEDEDLVIGATEY